MNDSTNELPISLPRTNYTTLSSIPAVPHRLVSVRRDLYLLSAVEQGFEPRSATLKAAVLPLNYSSITLSIKIIELTILPGGISVMDQKGV